MVATAHDVANKLEAGIPIGTTRLSGLRRLLGPRTVMDEALRSRP